MLDYMLIREREKPLWEKNDPTTLKYLVVDELHTFDGAQAADLACLVRRLKLRLRMDDGALCCIGTSATLMLAIGVLSAFRACRLTSVDHAADGLMVKKPAISWPVVPI